MAKYLRIFSDIHLDFDIKSQFYLSPKQVWSPQPLDTDKETILVLAGDLWHSNLAFKVLPNGESWFAHVAQRFEQVVAVLGNHDYWGLSLQSAPRKAQEACWKIPNAVVLEKDIFIHSGIKFIGATMWTDFGRNPLAMEIARNMMVDYKKITFGTGSSRRKARPQDIFRDHIDAVKFIFDNAKANSPDQKVVVITHMAPHPLSVHERYKDEHLENLSYYTNLDPKLYEHGQDIRLWVHGHMHHTADYVLEPTRVIVNPRGYEPTGEKTEYDPISRYEIDAL